MEEADFNNLKSHKGKKINSYSLGFKVQAIEYAKKHSKEGTARMFGVDARRIRDWCSMEGKLMAEYESGSERKRLKGAGRQVVSETMEHILLEWIEKQRREGLRVSRKMVQVKAMDLWRNDASVRDNAATESFVGSRGWLEGFFVRHQSSICRHPSERRHCTKRQTAPKRQADPPHKKSRQSLGRKIQTLLGSSCSDDEEPSHLFAPIGDSDIESSDMDSMDHSFREDVATSTEFKKEPESDDMFGQEVFYDECGNLLPPPMELPTTAPPTGVMSTAAEATNRKDKGAVPALDSASFWRSCNVAGCTQAIFEDLIMEISNISTRIQSHQASQEDYDTALKVIMASGKLPKLVKKQQNALRGKQIELQRSLEAMQDVESVLRR